MLQGLSPLRRWTTKSHHPIYQLLSSLRPRQANSGAAMDPITIISLIETCGALAMSASKLAIGLNALTENYKQAAMTFRSVSTQCNLFACSVRAIEQWMSNIPEGHVIDQSIEDQLIDSLACASDVIGALEAELEATSGADVNNIWKRTRVIWNQQAIRELEDAIMKQISGISVILQVMNLPTPQKQIASLKQRDPVFRQSRSSAMFVVHGCKATSSHSSHGVSIASTPDSTRSRLPKFDSESALRNSRAYLINRRTSLASKVSNERTGQSYRDVETWVAPSDLPAVPAEHRHLQWYQHDHDLRRSQPLIPQRHTILMPHSIQIRQSETLLLRS